MTIVDEARAITEQSKQARAVAAHLRAYGSISNHMAIYQGVPGYGVITRLGARIHELRREHGYKIATTKEGRDTVYKLIALPQPKQLSLV